MLGRDHRGPVALSDDDLPTPKSSDGPVESIRVLAMVRDTGHRQTSLRRAHRSQPDLRPARQARGLSLQTVADHFGIWPMHISTVERGKRRDDDFTRRYREWLNAA